ncbi:MAG: carbamoyltransferase HypF [Tepidisphaeraceae bacterium]
MRRRSVQLDNSSPVRRRWHVTGQVQGVGFRPFVFNLARDLHLSGLVRNDAKGVLIEAQGPARELNRFERQIKTDTPPLARIDSMAGNDIVPAPGESDFRIEVSLDAATAAAEVTVDTAVCPDCLREMLEPKDRRYRYGLINCTNCGPRFTIVRRVPYDRPNTTMAGFAMCPACGREYANPADRRFHAQPIACPACGPRVELVDNQGLKIAADPFDGAARRLRAGQIVAIKGLGGFHLACDATSAEAVAKLRQRKNRDSKPFALMVRSLDEARTLVHLSESAAGLLTSPACPIVLCPRRSATSVLAGADCPDIHNFSRPARTPAPLVADAVHRLGIMLPYTPVQHLLFAADPQLPPLVMTSANISDEPLVIANQEALARLGSMCDAILWHDRPIERPVDDSVLIDMGDDEDPLPIRRARGLVPAAIDLPVYAAAGLAVGAELKATVAVVRDGKAILSHHLGDLTHAASYDCFRNAIVDMRLLFGVQPRWIAHDMHPLYLSTSAASELANELGVPTVAVQHHHAHAAAVLAEHGIAGPVLAVICDGVGYGSDGQIWGGELLAADLKDFTRVGHITPMPLAGGDAAARDTRRCAMALLMQAFGKKFVELPIASRIMPKKSDREFIAGMLRQNVRCVPSTAAGRLFDGVAAILGVCEKNTHEAEAAMKLEALASTGAYVEGEPDYFTVERDQPLRINFSPLVTQLVDRIGKGHSAADLAALFHRQFDAAWVAMIELAAVATGLNRVAISGGVFCNEILTKGLIRRLTRRGFEVLRHRRVPPNDGGIALGQAAVAAARMGGHTCA